LSEPINQIVELVEQEARKRGPHCHDYVAALHAVLMEVSLGVAQVMEKIRREERLNRSADPGRE